MAGGCPLSDIYPIARPCDSARPWPVRHRTSAADRHDPRSRRLPRRLMRSRSRSPLSQPPGAAHDDLGRQQRTTEVLIAELGATCRRSRPPRTWLPGPVRPGNGQSAGKSRSGRPAGLQVQSALRRSRTLPAAEVAEVAAVCDLPCPRAPAERSARWSSAPPATRCSCSESGDYLTQQGIVQISPAHLGRVLAEAGLVDPAHPQTGTPSAALLCDDVIARARGDELVCADNVGIRPGPLPAGARADGSSAG